MRRAMLVTGAWVLLACFPLSVDAERTVLSLTDVTAIANAEGVGHVLFRIEDGDLPSSLAISRAILTVPVSGRAVAGRLDLRVYAVSRDWSAGGASWADGWERGGGGLHDRLYAEGELDLSGGAGSLTFDLTSLLKYAKEEGETIRGFLLTARSRDGHGIPAAHRARFSQLDRATVEVSYRKVRPMSRRLAQEIAADRQPAKLESDSPRDRSRGGSR